MNQQVMNGVCGHGQLDTTAQATSESRLTSHLYPKMQEIVSRTFQLQMYSKK